jgi:16S rRNA pseudouridine516 synthase
MERLDKIIASQTEYSRKDVKYLALKRKITVNGEIIFRSDIKVDPDKDLIAIDGKDIKVKEYVYLILNKPQGYISATEDRTQQTVIELVPEEFKCRDVFPVGRLDKDTTGLMILSDNGEFAHNILAPKKHVRKLYNVTIDIPMTEEMVIGFKRGVSLNDGECKSANLQITGTNTGIVTLTEGRYHQIKRMFGCYKAKVIELHRIGMGNLILPDNLKIGECRELTKEELNKIKEKN